MLHRQQITAFGKRYIQCAKIDCFFGQKKYFCTHYVHLRTLFVHATSRGIFL